MGRLSLPVIPTKKIEEFCFVSSVLTPLFEIASVINQCTLQI